MVSGLGSLADVRARLAELPDGVHEESTPHHSWWVGAGHDRWTVHHVQGLLSRRSPEWAGLAPDQLVVADSGAWATRGAEAEAYLDHWGVNYDVIEIPAGERSKDHRIVQRLIREFARRKLGRSGPIVAFGGGAAADTVRTAAAWWRRGTTCVCIATSPLAAVDAAVGLKHFIDLPVGGGTVLKNPIGGYAPALVTLADPDLFATVPEEHARSATAEMLKMAIVDRRLLTMLEEPDAIAFQAGGWADPAASATLALATLRMLQRLQRNPRDGDTRRDVDFGHFVGKVIELQARPPIPHGFSVAVCMALTLVASARRGLLAWDEANRWLGIMDRFDLPTWHETLTEAAFSHAIEEVTGQRGSQNVPVPTDEGVTFLQDLSVAELVEASRHLSAHVA